MNRSETPVLVAEAVSKRYASVLALDEVSIVVNEGETVALVGESGSGKSTLLKLFNARSQPTTGRVSVSGRAVVHWDAVELRRQIGYVPQNGGLLPHWTIEQNVALVPRLLGWEAAATGRRVHALLDQMGLAPAVYASRYPSELSGGERQRIAIARSLAADPAVVLLDEPFGALDAVTRARLQQQFVDLKAGLAKSLLLVTHDLSEAFRLADRVAVLKEGCILQVATPDQLLAAPDHPYVESLIELSEVRR